MKKIFIVFCLTVISILAQAFVSSTFAYDWKNYYDVVKELDYGYTIVAQDDKLGLVNDSKIIAKPQYDDIEEIKKGFYITTSGDKYGLIHWDTIVEEPKYDEIEPIDNEFFLIKLNNKYGLILNESVYVEPMYDEIKKLKDKPQRFKVKIDNKYGIMDNDEVQFKVIYDDIEEIKGSSYKTRIGDKYGLISGYKLVSEPIYDDIDDCLYAYGGYYKTRLGDKYGYIRFDTIIAEPIYDDIEPAKWGVKTKLGDKYGYGKVEPKYNDVLSFNDDKQPFLWWWHWSKNFSPWYNYYYTVIKDDNGIGAINNDDGKFIIKPNTKYEDVRINKGVREAKINGKWQSINKLQAGSTHLKNGLITTTNGVIKVVEAPVVPVAIVFQPIYFCSFLWIFFPEPLIFLEGLQ